MRKIWYIAFAILFILVFAIGVSAISNIGKVNDSDFVGAYTYSSWVVQVGYNGEGVIYDKTASSTGTNSDRFNWTRDGSNIFFYGAQNHGAFMQNYWIQNGCLVGQNGDITLVPYT